MPLALWGATLCFSLGALIIVLGLAILREDSRQRPNRWAAMMLSFGGLGALFVGLELAAKGAPGRGTVSAADATSYFSYLWEFFFPALLLFVLVFPREPRWFRKIPFLEALVFGPHVFHLVLTLVADRTHQTFFIPEVAARTGWASPLFGTLRVALGLLYQAHAFLFSLVNLAYVVVTLLVLGVRLREVTSPRLRDQLRAITIGLGVCLVLYSMAVPLPTVFRVGQDVAPGLRDALLVFALTVGSGSIAFAIVRYRFLDTGFLMRRGILFLLPALALILAYLGVVDFVKGFVSRWTSLDPRLFEPLLLLLAVSSLQPLVSRLEDVVEGFLLRDRREGRTVLQNLSRDLVTLLDMDELAGRLTGAVGESLLLERCVLYRRDGEGFEAVAAYGRAGGVRTGSELASEHALRDCGRWLAPESLGDGPALPADLLDSWPEGAEARASAGLFAAAVRTVELHLVVPVRHRDEALGVIALGPKITGSRFSHEDLALLDTLANQTGAAMKTASMYAESIRRAALDEELSLARQIQARYLPTSFPRTENLDVFGMNQASKQVGGDYFDIVEIDEGFLIAIADVSGKGVPAALVMSMMQASLRTQAGEGRPVSNVLERINRLMLARGETGMFATCFLGSLDRTSLELSYTNAGHNPPFLLRAEGRVELLSDGGLLLGVFDEPRLGEGRVRLLPGDRLVLYTDGVTEARSPAGEFFGEENLQAVLEAVRPDLTAEELAAHVRAALRAFTGTDELEDDMTLVVVRVPARRTTALESDSGEQLEGRLLTPAS